MGPKKILFYITRAAEDKKAKDILVLKLKGLTALTDYFFICTAESLVQSRAIADNIEMALKEKGISSRHGEGREGGRWILLDYDEIIVHIFYEETRIFYNLEGLWADAVQM